MRTRFTRSFDSLHVPRFLRVGDLAMGCPPMFGVDCKRSLVILLGSPWVACRRCLIKNPSRKTFFGKKAWLKGKSATDDIKALRSSSWVNTFDRPDRVSAYGLVQNNERGRWFCLIVRCAGHVSAV